MKVNCPICNKRIKRNDGTVALPYWYKGMPMHMGCFSERITTITVEIKETTKKAKSA